MADVRIAGNEVVATFGQWERVAVFRNEQRVPFSAIERAEVVSDPVGDLGVVSGIRMGAGLWPWAKVGTFGWRIGRGRTLAAVYKDRPALKLTIRPDSGIRFGDVIISTPNARHLADEITARIPGTGQAMAS